MSRPFYFNNQKCVTACLVHIDGKALMVHDSTTQRIQTSITAVDVDTVQKVLTNDLLDPILNKVKETIDAERFPITAAFAYAALVNVGKQFGITKILAGEDIRIHENRCVMTEMILGNNNRDFKMMFFSIAIDPDRAQLQELTATHILVDRNKVISKPSSTPGQELMDVYFMGLRMTQMTGIAVLLFWDLHFS